MSSLFARLRRSWLKRFGTDRQVIAMNFPGEDGRPLDLDHPQTFNEKIQWYKLYYRNPIMPLVSDKYRVREHLDQIGLSHLLNELYGVYDRADQINFDALPAAFVLKATHGSGMNIICRDKTALDREACRRTLARWLKTDYYRPGREWGYKDIRPRIVCEKYLENEDRGELLDYKFYCFSGKPHTVFVCCERFSPDGVKHQCFDTAWQPLPVLKGRIRSRLDLPRPRQFDEMLTIARKLSAGFPYIRVDLYLVQNRIIFGELTFYPDCGRIPFTPPEYNQIYGDLFVLPPKS